MGRAAVSLPEVGGSRRRYLGYECAEIDLALGALPDPVTVGQIFGVFAPYLHRRLQAPGPQGVKLNNLNILSYTNDFLSLPLCPIIVRRDLRTTFESDIKYRGPDPHRMEHLGRLFLGVHLLCQKLKPAMEIQYEDLLEAPRKHVEKMVVALDLHPESTKAAVESVTRSP